MLEKAVAPATATKHASCFADSAPQQQLSAIVAVAAANSNVDVAEYTTPQLLILINTRWAPLHASYLNEVLIMRGMAVPVKFE